LKLNWLIIWSALKNLQQFLSDSWQNLKGIKEVKPSEPADESWFEEPEHQKGLAIAAAGLADLAAQNERLAAIEREK
jgi:hypothetical protein